MMPDLCVAHLVRERNGPGPFAAFLDSYRRHPAGVGHDLLVIFKGFGGGAALAPYRELLGGLPFRPFEVPDEGFDIVPYFKAAARFDYRHFCFLNSFSVILDDGWLEKLYAPARAAGVGVVGATGSWESLYADYLRRWRRERSRWLYRGMLACEWAKLRAALRLRAQFGPFPNPHVRTNAFVVARDLLSRLEVGELKRKEDAHRFESGRAGMTRQIVALGLRPLVAGRDGRAYEWADWRESLTFRSGEQQNLLVSDNQTRQYAEADEPTRRVLREFAWREGAE